MGQAIRFKRWRLLSEAVDALGRTTSTEAALDVLRERALAIAGADGVHIVLRAGDDAVFTDENIIGPSWAKHGMPLRRCVAGIAMLERQVIIIPDIRRDARVPFNAYLATFVSSMAVFPIGIGEPIAALSVFWAEPRPIESDILALLNTLTRSASATVERLAVAAEIAASRRIG